MFIVDWMRLITGDRFFKASEDLETTQDIIKQVDHFENSASRDAKLSNQQVESFNRNDDVVSSIRLSYEKGAVGKGINIQYRSTDNDFNDEIELLLKEWSKK